MRGVWPFGYVGIVRNGLDFIIEESYVGEFILVMASVWRRVELEQEEIFVKVEGTI